MISEHRKIEIEIRKDIEREKVNYLENMKKQIKELNRKDIFNIIELIKKEKKFWQTNIIKLNDFS